VWTFRPACLLIRLVGSTEARWTTLSVHGRTRAAHTCTTPDPLIQSTCILTVCSQHHALNGCHTLQYYGFWIRVIDAPHHRTLQRVVNGEGGAQPLQALSCQQQVRHLIRCAVEGPQVAVTGQDHALKGCEMLLRRVRCNAVKLRFQRACCPEGANGAATREPVDLARSQLHP